MIPGGCFKTEGFIFGIILSCSLQGKIYERDMVNFILIYKQKHYNFLSSSVALCFLTAREI